MRQDFNSGVVSNITGTDIAAVAQIENFTDSSSGFISGLDCEAGDELQITFTGTPTTNFGNNNGLWIVISAAAGSLKLRHKTANKVMLAIASAAGITVNVHNKGQSGNVKDILFSYPSRFAAVADTAIFTTESGDFTVPFVVGDTVKADGFTGGNVGNNDKSFKITKLTSTTMFGYYTDGSLSVNDAATESVTITKNDSVKTTYSSTNALKIASVSSGTARLTVAPGSSFISEGFKVHDVVRLGGATTTATNKTRNLLIKSLTATDMYAIPLDTDVTTVPMVAEEFLGNEVATVTLVGSSAGVETVIIDGVTYTTGGIETPTVIATGIATLSFEGYTVTNPSAGVVKFTKIANGTVSDTALAATGTYISGGGTATIAITKQGRTTPTYIERVGAKAYIPQENHTNKSFMAEKWLSDITQSEQYTGLRVGTAKISAANSAIPKVDFDFIGKDLETAQAHYYTSSAEPDASGNLSTIFGAAYVGTVSVGSVTAFDLSIMANLSALDKCIGSDTTKNVVAGIYKVSGSMTLYFEDEVMRDHFLDKDELSQVFILRESDAYDADFIAFQLPRVVYNSAALTEDVKSSILTIPFTAFENPNGDDGAEKSKLMSMISIQDSQA